MIDLHSHILPGFDDGAPDLEFAIQMARMAVQDGVHCMAATPHNANGFPAFTREEVIEATRKLQEALADRGIELELIPGVEARIGPDIAQQLDSGQAFPIGQTRYLLLELPLSHYPPYTERAIFDLQIRGFIPIIAHPERNALLRERPNLLWRLVKRGCLAQLTAASLVGAFGEEVRRESEALLQHNLAHLIASDAHTLTLRSPSLSQAVEAASKIVGQERATALVSTVPRAILDDNDIQVEAPLEREASKSRWPWDRK